MSVMNKPDYKIFANDAKSGELVTFPDILRGWGVTLEQYNGFPPMELFNSAAKRIDEWLLYLTQRGLPEWDASVDYPKDALIQHTGIYYVALKVSKGDQPNNSQASWKKMSDFLGVDGKLAKDQNGADIPDKPKFIENLGLGEAAKSGLKQTTGTSKTDVMSQNGVTNLGNTKFDKTGGTVDGVVTVNRDGAAVVITAKTEGASVRYELKDSDGTVIGYVGTTSNTTDSPLVLRSNRGGVTLSLSDGASFTNGKRNLTTDDQSTALIAPSGWIKDKTTGLITQWMLVDTTTGTTGQTFNFPTQFPTSLLSLSTSLRSVANGYGAIAWQSVSNSSVTLVNVSANTGASKAYIVAMGY